MRVIDDNASVKKFWEDRHEDFAHFYKTTATIKEASSGLGIEPLEGKTVLCVGVGSGVQVKGIVDAGAKEVHGADISELGLANVAHLVKGSYLFPHFDAMPSSYFDVAISHVVAQHLNNEGLEHHLEHIIRALTPTGTLYLQSAFSTVGQEDFADCDITTGMMSEGGVYRSYNFIDTLVSSHGGAIVGSPKIRNFLDHPSNVGWYGLKIQRTN